MNNEKIIQYLDAMRQLLKYDRAHVQKPLVWTEPLNTYIDNVLKVKFMALTKVILGGNHFTDKCSPTLYPFSVVKLIGPSYIRS